jgi:hypothetical protein
MANDSHHNSGRAWHLDRQKHNKSEDWEEPMRSRKLRYKVKRKPQEKKFLGIFEDGGMPDNDRYFHILKYGENGEISHISYFLTLEEAQKEIERLNSIYPNNNYSPFVSSSKNPPSIVNSYESGGGVGELKKYSVGIRLFSDETDDIGYGYIHVMAKDSDDAIKQAEKICKDYNKGKSNPYIYEDSTMDRGDVWDAEYEIQVNTDDGLNPHLQDVKMANGGGVGYIVPNTVSEYTEKMNDFSRRLGTAESLWKMDNGKSYKRVIAEQNDYYLKTKDAWYKELSEAEASGNLARYNVLLKMINEAFRYESGGGVGKRRTKNYNYIPNRMIQSVEVKKGRKVTEIDGDNVLDGVYVRGKVKFAGGGMTESDKENQVRSNLVDGRIEMNTLKEIMGCEPNYPNQIIGSIKLEKCFLLPYYRLA